MNTSSSCSMWVLENAIFNIMLLDYETGMSCKDRWKWKERIKSISHMFGKLAWIKVRKRKIYLHFFFCVTKATLNTELQRKVTIIIPLQTWIQLKNNEICFEIVTNPSSMCVDEINKAFCIIPQNCKFWLYVLKTLLECISKTVLNQKI